MNISIIGTGNMGTAVALGLLAAGHRVTVYNRTRKKAERLVPMGARVVGSAAEAIAVSEYSIVVLLDEKSTRSVLLAEDTVAELAGGALISAAAMSPEEIVALSRDVAAAGGALSEVNILTYPDEVAARKSEFIIAAVPENAVTWRKIFSDLGPKVYDVGAVGNAAKAQMSLWLSYMFLTIATSYSVTAFEKLGLPIKVAQSVLAGNPSISIAGANDMIPEMAKRAYGKDRWSVDNMVLSIDQAIVFAARLKIDTTVMKAVRDVYARTSAMGYGGFDITAIYEAVNPRG
jgi:3-hydroxyisobutyrate dehydrogenase-like beta-hydroxyacid dehydrogenase